jgi:hypothetical protein
LEGLQLWLPVGLHGMDGLHACACLPACLHACAAAAYVRCSTLVFIV